MLPRRTAAPSRRRLGDRPECRLARRRRSACSMHVCTDGDQTRITASPGVAASLLSRLTTGICSTMAVAATSASRTGTRRPPARRAATIRASSALPASTCSGAHVDSTAESVGRSRRSVSVAGREHTHRQLGVHDHDRDLGVGQPSRLATGSSRLRRDEEGAVEHGPHTLSVVSENRARTSPRRPRSAA